MNLKLIMAGSQRDLAQEPLTRRLDPFLDHLFDSELRTRRSVSGATALRDFADLLGVRPRLLLLARAHLQREIDSSQTQKTAKLVADRRVAFPELAGEFGAAAGL